MIMLADTAVPPPPAPDTVGMGAAASRSPFEADAGLAACLARVREGSQAAAAELVAQVRPLVLRIVRRRLPRRAAEEDLVQEILIKMFSRLSQYHGGAPFTHWLARIALRTCFDHLRAQRCRPELRRADLADELNAHLEATLADTSSSHPGERLGAREIVARALAGLKPDDRRIVVLFHLADMSMAEISQATGWDVEFVKMRLFRARGKLQRLILNMPKWDALGCPPSRPAIKTRKAARRRCADLGTPAEIRAA
jgi:RNA polymerase sigma-70 factor (ECF subfamily)